MKKTLLLIAMILQEGFCQNSALNFDGNSYVKLTNNLTAFNYYSFTLEAWVKPTAFAAGTDSYQNTIIGYDGWDAAGNNYGYALRTGGSRKLEFVYGQSGSWFTFTTANAVLPLNTYSHVAMVKDAGSIKLYVNGAEVFSGSSGISAISYNSSQLPKFNIGENGKESGRKFVGAIQEVKIWNGPRTASQVLSDMHQLCNANVTNLDAYYKLNETTGTTFASANGLNYNAVLSGSSGILSTQSKLLEYPIYVNDNATGSNNGTSWTNAFTSLQTALEAFSTGFPTCQGPSAQIWVAAGNYLPTKDLAGSSSPSNPRTKTFALRNNLTLYGGFAGNESVNFDLSFRDFGLNTSVLNGNINSPNSISDNAYHVVTNANNQDASAVVDGFLIQNGRANYNQNNSDVGGGIFNDQATCTVRNCILEKNTATSGGAIAQLGAVGVGTLHISDSKIQKNTAQYGGGIYITSSSLTVNNTEILNDTASVSGGGIWAKNATLTIDLSNFKENLSNFDNTANLLNQGGGALFSENCTLTLSGTLFKNNNAISFGGGIIAFGTGSIQSTSCRFEDNSCVDGGGAIFSQVPLQVSKCEFTRNITNDTNGRAGAIFVQNIDAFIEKSTFTANKGNFGSAIRLKQNNANLTKIVSCIFKDNTPKNISYAHVILAENSDAGISSKIYNCLFLNNQTGFARSHIGNMILRNCIALNSGGTQVDASGSLTMSNTFTSGNMNFVSSTDYHLTACSLPVNEGILDGDTPTTDFDGNPLFGVPDAGPFEFQGQKLQAKAYVNKLATGLNNGSSWANAYTNLQDAINNVCSEILIAEGNYTPHATNSSISFVFNKSIKVYGGYSATDSTQPRNPSLYPTILSGEIGNSASLTDNSQTVLETKGLDQSSLFDGLVIEKGQIGIRNTTFNGFGSNPTFNNMIIRNNVGRGMRNYIDSNPKIENSIFEANAGGALENIQNSNPSLQNVIFRHHNTTVDGAAVKNEISSPSFKKCIFENNITTANGGAVYNQNSNSYFHTSIFRNNTAANGGASYNFNNKNTYISCLFHGNSATTGGTMSCYYSNDSLANCTITKNSSGLYLAISEPPVIVNSIIWGNDGNHTLSSGVNVSYSHIQGGYVGTENSSDKPYFKSETDFRIQPCSSGINTGKNLSYPTLELDLHGNLRIDSRVDRGAYELYGLFKPNLTYNPSLEIWDKISFYYNKIVMTNTIRNNYSFANVWLQTRTSIEFLPGFEIKAGAIVTAEVGCQN